MLFIRACDYATSIAFILLDVGTVYDHENKSAGYEKLKRIVQRSTTNFCLPHLKQRTTEHGRTGRLLEVRREVANGFVVLLNPRGYLAGTRSLGTLRLPRRTISSSSGTS